MGIYDNRLIKYPRGSIWMCDLSQINIIPGVQSGNRPVVVMSSNIGNITSNSVLVALITSNSEKSRHSINIPFINTEGDCNVILCNQLHTINKNALAFHMGMLPETVIYNVENAINKALGIQQKEATIAEIEVMINKVLEIYNRNLEIMQNNSVTNQANIDSIAEKIEELLREVVIPLEKEAGDKPISKLGNTNEVKYSKLSPKNFEVGDNTDKTKKKARGFWTNARKIEYIQDKENMTLEKLAAKWSMKSTKTAYQMYYQFKKQLNK